MREAPVSGSILPGAERWSRRSVGLELLGEYFRFSGLMRLLTQSPHTQALSPMLSEVPRGSELEHIRSPVYFLRARAFAAPSVSNQALEAKVCGPCNQIMPPGGSLSAYRHHRVPLHFCPTGPLRWHRTLHRSPCGGIGTKRCGSGGLLQRRIHRQCRKTIMLSASGMASFHGNVRHVEGTG